MFYIQSVEYVEERELGRFRLFLLNIGICGANDFKQINDFSNDFSDHILFVSFMEIGQATSGVTQSPGNYFILIRFWSSSNYFILICFLSHEFSLYTYILENITECFSENNSSLL